jgi:predicted ATPase/DNA-binding SARP family transcriptional activator
MAVPTTGRLPVRLTPLVGRDRDLDEVARALAGGRLLTLTGPGGVGKTRLALAVAVRLTAQNADVAWADLAQVSDPLAIEQTVAASLGARACPGPDPFTAVAAHLAASRDGNARPLFIVLDGCEHATVAVAGVAERLLADCPAVSIVATSREPLGVEGERAWHVPPLGQAHAARLFEDRARLVAPSFTVTDANREAVTHVCARLDGLPLAIELAAARLRVLSVGQLAERLEDMFGVLVGGARSAPPRHQALRATLDWSYDLLTGEERTVFRRLATFADGFSLAAAERVAAFGDIAASQVLDLLARLADKSLVQVEGERYRLLTTIREYAAVLLAEAGERDRARREHLRYYTEFAERAGSRGERATAGDLAAEFGRLDQEKANLRAAAEYAEHAASAAGPRGEDNAAAEGVSNAEAEAALRAIGQLEAGLRRLRLAARPGFAELVTSPLTGATPVMTAPPAVSPLTGASAVMTETPPSSPGPRRSVDGGEQAAVVRDSGVNSVRFERVAGPASALGAARPPMRAGPSVRPSGPLRVRALGGATVEVGGTALTAADWGYAKPRELLFLLITSPPLTREQLRAALWPELSGKQLGNALHTALRELRRALGAQDWVRYAAGHYSVNRDRVVDCDVDTFESSLAAAGRARPASAGLPDLRRAVAAYGGDFLAGMTAGEWASARRDELRRRFETALLAAGRLHVAAGRHQAAVTAFRRAIEHEPLNESAHRELMSCWAALGETARAVRHYADLTALLNDRVGVPPAAETTALYERLGGSKR